MRNQRTFNIPHGLLGGNLCRGKKMDLINRTGIACHYPSSYHPWQGGKKFLGAFYGEYAPG
jgi:hypothetical protein